MAFRSRLNSTAAESEDTRLLRRELAKLEEERARLDDRIREMRAKLEFEGRGDTNCQGAVIEGTAEPVVDMQ